MTFGALIQVSGKWEIPPGPETHAILIGTASEIQNDSKYDEPGQRDDLESGAPELELAKLSQMQVIQLTWPISYPPVGRY